MRSPVAYCASRESISDVIKSAAEVKVIAQEGVDPVLTSWVNQGANFVAKTFDYPKLTRSFVDVIAIDRTWLESAYTKEGFSVQQVKDRLGGFDTGSPAFGGSFSNTWNYAAIKKNNLLVNDKTGMAQTAGHEFFHAIQERLAGRNPGADGATIPNWIWEGPAMFIGLQTSSKLGIVDYLTIGQQSSINRYKNDSEAMKKLPLSEVKKNDKDTDPYGLGEVATKFIVANVGIEKLLGVYGALGQGKTFAQAFEVGTGVKLDDFYSMFEESRPTLGVPLGLSANTAPAPTPSPAPAPTVTPTPTASPALAKFTMDEVKKHSSAADCWAVVSGGVYDLTKWAALHPGGPAIIRSLCGRDATSDFLGRHENQPDPARELSNYIIGKLD